MHSLSHSATHITITNELTLRTLTQQCTFRQLSPVAPSRVLFRRRHQHTYHSTKVPTAHIYDFITLFFTFPALSWSLVGNAGHPGYYGVLPDLYFLHRLNNRTGSAHEWLNVRGISVDLFKLVRETLNSNWELCCCRCNNWMCVWWIVVKKIVKFVSIIAS